MLDGAEEHELVVGGLVDVVERSRVTGIEGHAGGEEARDRQPLNLEGSVPAGGVDPDPLARVPGREDRRRDPERGVGGSQLDPEGEAEDDEALPSLPVGEDEVARQGVHVHPVGRRRRQRARLPET